MHVLINKYKIYLKNILTVFLCIIAVSISELENTNAFQVTGNGNNLRVIQTQNSKSSSFQVNAKLKPTAIARTIVPNVILPTGGGSSTENPPENYSDGSSPYLGTANWGYKNRSKKATERKRLAQKESNSHASAPPAEKEPKTEPENNNSNNTTEPIVTNPPKNSPSDKQNRIDSYNPHKDRFVATGDSKVELNPAKFSLKFLETDVVDSSQTKKYQKCKNIVYFKKYNTDNDYWFLIAKSLFLILICLTGIFFCLTILIYLMWKKSRKKKKKTAKKSFWQKFKKLIPILFLILAVTSENASAGPVTTPQQLIYEGDLLDNAGNPLTGNYSFRFSLWDNEDYEASDVIAGNINTGAADYFNWKEVQTQSLANGKFSLKLGTVEPFFAGLFDHTNMYLQIEVKNAADPDTNYELIDLNSTNDTIDRTIIDTIPFAFNADKLDFHDLGYNPGEIPYIEAGGKLPGSIIPTNAVDLIDGINGNNFTLDLDGNALGTDILALKFGDSLNKTLAWNGVNNQFEFNDKVNIAGNLVVTGTINGTTVGPRNKTEVLSPRYPNSVINQDGTNNSGSMYEETIDIAGKEKNILKWHTRQTSMQDFDIVTRYVLPTNFTGFQVNPVSLELMTEGLNTDAKVDFVIEKEGSTVDELSGAGIGLNSNSWTTVDFNLNAGTTWNPNDIMVIKMRMYSRDNIQSYVSDVTLKYIET